MKVSELIEGVPGVKVAQSKATQKKLRAAGMMEKPGHYHKKGEDWESTKVIKPKELREEKKQANLEELRQKALDIIFKVVEKEIIETGDWDVREIVGYLNPHELLDDLLKPYEWTDELDKMSDRLFKSGAPYEAMFKDKYGMTPRKWLEQRDKSELAKLPEQQQKLLKKIGDYMTVKLFPSDFQRGDVRIYKKSATGLGVEAHGMEIIFRPKFFEEFGLTMAEATELLTKLGASMKKRPKPFKSSPSLYD